MLGSGRKVKIAAGSFANFFKHLALYHIGEVTTQDLPAALGLKNGNTKAPVAEAAAETSGSKTLKEAFEASTPAAMAALAASAAAVRHTTTPPTILRLRLFSARAAHSDDDSEVEPRRIQGIAASVSSTNS